MLPMHTLSTRDVVHRHAKRGRAPVDGSPLGQLLIVTQAVDLDDPVLGFFHRWIEEFSKHSDTLSVICLKEGRHSLPANVSVYSLGKERGASRIKYIWNFYRYIWKLRNDYDAVFVHMNEEYVLLGGKLWRPMRKRVVLWRNHKKGSILTRLAGLFSHTVCYTSESAYVASFRNAVRMPIGIDTDLFKPDTGADPLSILFLGRLDPVKNADVFIKAINKLSDDGVELTADVYGDPTPGNEEYAHDVRKKAAIPALKDRVRLHAGITHAQTPGIYRAHTIYVNLTPSGSFDKTIGEAMASGCIPVVANEALRGIVPDYLIVEPASIESVAAGIARALSLKDNERATLRTSARNYAVKAHSLQLLAGKLLSLLGEHV